MIYALVLLVSIELCFEVSRFLGLMVAKDRSRITADLCGLLADGGYSLQHGLFRHIAHIFSPPLLGSVTNIERATTSSVASIKMQYEFRNIISNRHDISASNIVMTMPIMRNIVFCFFVSGLFLFSTGAYTAVIRIDSAMMQ